MEIYIVTLRKITDNTMKALKCLAIALMLLPFTAAAQKTSQTAKKTAVVSTSSEAAKYPLYDDVEAAKLWKMWIKKTPFSQADYERVIALSDASFSYLTVELQEICNRTSSPTKRVQLATDLDKGITSNMANFARTFALRLQKLYEQGELSQENMISFMTMFEKKQVYRRINQEVYHPSK